MRRAVVIAVFFISFLGVAQGGQWITKKSIEGEFKLEFPDTPKYSTETVPTVKGDVTMDSFSYQEPDSSKENFIYMIAFTKYPDSFFPNGLSDSSQIDTVLNNAVNGAVQNTNGNLISNKSISFNGFQGKEAKISISDNAYIIKMRLYIVGLTLYTVQVIYDKKNDDNNTATYFFNSFELIKTNKK